jgi:hypothetical protein
MNVAIPANLSGSAGQLIYMPDIRADNRVTDRCVRNWIASGRFPPPSGNLNGRNFWTLDVYRQWQAELQAGKYALHRRPGSARSAPTTAVA